MIIVIVPISPSQKEFNQSYYLNLSHKIGNYGINLANCNFGNEPQAPASLLNPMPATETLGARACPSQYNSMPKLQFKMRLVTRCLETIEPCRNLWAGAVSRNWEQSSLLIKDGNIGIGTTTPTETLSVNGNVSIEGTNCRDSGGSAICNNFVDIAELFPSSEAVDSGDIVIVDFENKGKIKKSHKEYEKAVVGIVSTQPAIVIEGGRIIAMGGYKGQNDTLKPAIALAGRVPVKASEENGRIIAGDLLTTSSRAGYAMKCNDELKCLNSVVGIALDDKKDNEETVLVLVK